MTLLATAPVAGTEDGLALALGPYRARISREASVRQRALSLRLSAFRTTGLTDEDSFDPLSLHGIVTDTRTDQTCVAFRTRVMGTGDDLDATYTGQSYDLAPLRKVRGPFIELGRVCHNAKQPDPLALRLAWAALAALVDGHSATMLIGCTSFPGADLNLHVDALSYLRRQHLGAPHLRPHRRSTFAADLPRSNGSANDIPQLLRSYLAMGGWVGDHAVVDPVIDTVHVFTGLTIADIPAPRKKRLRALAAAARLPA